MKWNAFDLFDPAFNKTKELLFPIDLKYWIKLAFVSLLSSGNSYGSGLRSSSFNLPSQTSRESTNEITGNVVSGLDKVTFGLIGGLLVVGTLLLLLFKYITSTFTFIFIEAVIKKNFTIKESWRNNKGNGLSFFGFRLISGIVFLGVSALIFLPILVRIFKIGFETFFDTLSITSLGAFILFFILFLIWVFLFSTFMTFVSNFSLIDMYKNSVGITRAIKNTFGLMRSQKLESFVYFVAVIVFGVVVGIISLLILLPFLLVFGLIGFVLYLIFSFISSVVMVVVLVIYGIFLMYLLVMVFLPFRVFLRYFSIFGYEKLYNAKVI
jgi:hypothetical protein